MGVEPKEIRAGDTVGWARALSAYPASSGWVLSYFLARPGQEILTIAATASGDDHLVSQDATTTSAWVPGTYRWTASVAKGVERFTLDSGSLVILPDPSSTHDPRDPIEIELENVRAALAKLRKDPISEYEIDGTKARKRDIEELRREEARLVHQLRRKRGGALMRSYPVRLG